MEGGGVVGESRGTGLAAGAEWVEVRVGGAGYAGATVPDGQVGGAGSAGTGGWVLVGSRSWAAAAVG